MMYVRHMWRTPTTNACIIGYTTNKSLPVINFGLQIITGTNEETARELIRNSGLKLEMIDNLDKAAQAAVASA